MAYPSREFIKRIIKVGNKEQVTKNYNYRAVTKNGIHKIYRRIFFEDPWELYITIPVGEVDDFSSWEIHDVSYREYTVCAKEGKRRQCT